MKKYNNDHQLILKAFPFVLLEVKKASDYFNYYINNKKDRTFWYNILDKWWNGYGSIFSSTY